MRHFLNRFGQVGKKFPLLIASLIMVITSGIYLLGTQSHQAEAIVTDAVASESATVNTSKPVTKIGFLKKIVNLEPVNKTDEVISNPSATPTPSPTSSSTSTPNPTPTPTPTITPTPTSTPTPTPTLTPTPTPTPSPSPTLAPAETSAYNFNFGSNHSAVANATGTITLSMIRNQNGYWDLQISGSFTGLVADRTYQVWICGINCSSHSSAKFTADSQGSASYSTTINHAQANDPANRIVLWEVPPTGEVIENSTTCYQLSNNSTPCLSAPIAW